MSIEIGSICYEPHGHRVEIVGVEHNAYTQKDVYEAIVISERPGIFKAGRHVYYTADKFLAVKPSKIEGVPKWLSDMWLK